MNRVLIITYYWPPSGGSAVLRWLKFCKYLRNFGWEPVIYTPENPEPQEIDESLLQDIPENMEILKTRITEPYSIYKWITGKKQSERLGVSLMSDSGKKSFLGTLSLWIRSNIFIPDPRMLWIRPSVRNLTQYLKENPVDIIISTGPPHSMHLIAMKLKNKLGIKWIADFRDPWTNIDFYQDLLLTRYADLCHKRLERSVLATADRVVTVSPGMTEEFRQMGFLNVSTITNGFDEIAEQQQTPPLNRFSITHLGSLPRSRNPFSLWKVLSDLVAENPDFCNQLEIQLIGKTDQTIIESLNLHKLDKFVTRIPFVPHYETSKILNSSSVLLLCINNTPNANGILTNKFFEYLSARRPIIGIGPVNGDASYILHQTGAGRIFDYNDVADLKKYILHLFDVYTQKKLVILSNGITQFSRKNLTEQLSRLLNDLKN